MRSVNFKKKIIESGDIHEKDINPSSVSQDISTLSLQRPTVPLWKGLDSGVKTISAQETGSILKIGSKRL